MTQQPPHANKRLELSEHLCELTARAILDTRVSHFTPEEREQLQFVMSVLGYHIKDGRRL